MRLRLAVRSLCAIAVMFALPLAEAQKAQKSQDVPQNVRFGSALRDASGTPRTGTVPIMFSLYRSATGGAPIWQETQNVILDDQGRFSVLLGAVSRFPSGLFATNEARWLGVQVLADAEAEQPRVMLVSVPYALKAQDAETLGGLPASAYVRADAVGMAPSPGSKRNGQAAALESEGTVVTNTSHTVNAIPKFSATDTLADSMLWEQYNQAGLDAFNVSVGTEDVVRIGDGTGNQKRLQIAGRMVSTGFDVVSSLFSSVHVVNNNPAGVGFQINVSSQTADFTNGVFASAQSNNAFAIEGIVFEPTSPSTVGVDYSYAIAGVNRQQEGAALYGVSLYDGAGGAGFPQPSGPVGLYASVAHSTAIAAILDQRAGSGKIISARNNGSEVMSMNTAGNITTSGSVTAASFSGSGASLTGVTASTASALASDPLACAANRFVTDIAADGTLTCAQPSTSNLSDGASLATLTYVDAADTALAAPQYVTLAATGTLANERVLTAGKGIALTDSGSTVTIDNKVDFAQTSVQAGDFLQGPTGSATDFATTYTIPANTITIGSVIEIWAAGAQSSDPSSASTFGYALGIGSSLVSPTVNYTQNAGVTNGWNLTVRVICTDIVSGIATLEAHGTITSGSGAAGIHSHGLFSAGLGLNITNPLVVKVRETVALTGTSNTTMRQLIVKIYK